MKLYSFRERKLIISIWSTSFLSYRSDLQALIESASLHHFNTLGLYHLGKGSHHQKTILGLFRAAQLGATCKILLSSLNVFFSLINTTPTTPSLWNSFGLQ